MKKTHIAISSELINRIQKIADRVGQPAEEITQKILLQELEKMESLAQTLDEADEVIERLKDDPENAKLFDIISRGEKSSDIDSQSDQSNTDQASPLPLCSYTELEDYLTKINELDLLNNIEKTGDSYDLSSTYKSRKTQYPPSTLLQISAALAVLGEFKKAESVYALNWSNISPSYDKVANGIMKEFIKPWPI